MSFSSLYSVSFSVNVYSSAIREHELDRTVTNYQDLIKEHVFPARISQDI